MIRKVSLRAIHLRNPALVCLLTRDMARYEPKAIQWFMEALNSRFEALETNYEALKSELEASSEESQTSLA